MIIDNGQFSADFWDEVDQAATVAAINAAENADLVKAEAFLNGAQGLHHQVVNGFLHVNRDALMIWMERLGWNPTPEVERWSREARAQALKHLNDHYREMENAQESPGAIPG